MKKQLLSIMLIACATFAMAQNSNCTKIKQLISEANKKQLQAEAKGEKYQTEEQFDAWTAGTTLDGATKCYVQDAHVSKMYVAEFGYAPEGKTADPALSKKLEELATMFQNCLGTGFMIRPVSASENIFKGYQYSGRGENLNTKITLMLVDNPADKKQMLFISLINDPD